MEHRLPDRPRILFLFSDAGGGHRSAAEAIIEAINLEFPGQIETDMVDLLKEYGPPPINRLPDWYPGMVRYPGAMKLAYRLTNHPKQVTFGRQSLLPYVRKQVKRLMREHPCDLFVSVHPGGNFSVLPLLGADDPAHITVVTDLVTTHAFWYHPKTHLCLVPTEAAREQALCFGMQPEQMRVVGLPVASKFCQSSADRFELRRDLGLSQEGLIILLVGGGEGMGPILETAQAISQRCVGVSLVVVAGRNRQLKQCLEEYQWKIPVKIFGFTRQMPELMQAADILVTKAGPGTICEAFLAGLPMVIYSYLPGNEDGNLTYVVSEGAGIWAPQPRKTAEAVRAWIDYPDKRLRAAAASRRLARPLAARQTAHILADNLKSPFAENNTMELNNESG